MNVDALTSDVRALDRAFDAFDDMRAEAGDFVRFDSVWIGGDPINGLSHCRQRYHLCSSPWHDASLFEGRHIEPETCDNVAPDIYGKAICKPYLTLEKVAIDSTHHVSNN